MRDDINEGLLALSLACVQCKSEEQLEAIFHEYVEPLLPNKGVLLLVARRHSTKLRLQYSISVGYGERATRNALAADDTSERKALQTWLATGTPIVVNLPADRHLVSQLEADEIMDLRLGRIAAHGLLDPSRQLGSYMTYSGLDTNLSKETVVERLQLITPPLHQALMQVLSQTAPNPGSTPELSPVEHELIDWIAAGKTNAEIAKLRFRSVNTIRNQLAALFAKLDASNRAEAVARARGLYPHAV